MHVRSEPEEAALCRKNVMAAVLHDMDAEGPVGPQELAADGPGFLEGVQKVPAIRRQDVVAVGSLEPGESFKVLGLLAND